MRQVIKPGVIGNLLNAHVGGQEELGGNADAIIDEMLVQRLPDAAFDQFAEVAGIEMKLRGNFRIGDRLVIVGIDVV